jgi:hypothetical protein
MKYKFKKSIKILAILVCSYLIFLSCGFFAVKYGITNTPGVVDVNNNKFQKNADIVSGIARVEAASDSNIGVIAKIKNENFCKINAIGEISRLNAERILAIYQKTQNDTLVAKMILAVVLRLKDYAIFQDKISNCENNSQGVDYVSEIAKMDFSQNDGQNVFTWANEAEWNTIKSGVLKDKDIINKAGNSAGIEPRLIVAALIVEQLRLFHSQRELFKKFFEPLKILGDSTKISLGVMGIKEATAIETEKHLKDPTSQYYLGIQYEHLLDLDSGDPAQERFFRLTDDKNHYYSYLYGAVYLKEMLAQWKHAGYDIKYRPEIIETLFNVGFPQSKPNSTPKVGGSSINIGDGAYSFGSLAYEFYYSGELGDDFSYLTN